MVFKTIRLFQQKCLNSKGKDKEIPTVRRHGTTHVRIPLFFPLLFKFIILVLMLTVFYYV